jgi:hypothetical protein
VWVTVPLPARYFVLSLSGGNTAIVESLSNAEQRHVAAIIWCLRNLELPDASTPHEAFRVLSSSDSIRHADGTRPSAADVLEGFRAFVLALHGLLHANDVYLGDGTSLEEQVQEVLSCNQWLALCSILETSDGGLIRGSIPMPTFPAYQGLRVEDVEVALRGLHGEMTLAWLTMAVPGAVS